MEVMTINTKNIKGPVMLALCALIWGSAFVAQSSAMDFVGPFTFQAVRSVIGAVVLLPFTLVTGKKNNKGNSKSEKKLLITGGIICGIVLCTASCFQQFGIYYNNLSGASGAVVGKAGFITALYILIVPIIGLFFKRKISVKVWIGIFLSVAGLYLLCMTGKQTPDFGDVLLFICAIVFSIHILVVDYFSPKVDGVKLSCIQFFISGIAAAIPMLIFENPSLSAISDAWVEILYAGALSCGAAYTLQILAQKYTPPTIASMILSLESVFAVLAAALILKEYPTVVQIIGCVLMFAAIILAQVPDKKKL